MKKTFCILVPIYQNELNIPVTFERLKEVRTQLDSVNVEVLFVNDGSTDKSKVLLNAIHNEHRDWIKVINLSRNFGQTPAIQTGLRFTQADCIGIISADLQENPNHFLEMITLWQKGHKFIIGERILREENARHQMVSQTYWSIVKKFALPEFPSIGYDFCLIDKQIAQLVIHSDEKNTSIFVLLFWYGFKPTKIPIIRTNRALGKSQWSFKKKLIFTIDTLIGFTFVPARIISLFGFIFAFIFLIYLFGLLIQWFLFKTAPAGWMTVVTLLCLSSSMILSALGIVAEYLLRILDQGRKRPISVVDEVLDKNS